MIKHDDGEVDTTAIRFSPKPQYKAVEPWLIAKQEYCCKADNPILFGERIVSTLGQQQSDRKRTFDEIIKEADPTIAERMIQAWNPYEYVSRYPAYQRFLEDKALKFRKRRTAKTTIVYSSESWSVPEALLEWKRLNIDERRSGRACALVLVGESKVGKTEWAKSFGDPIVMTESWNMNLWRSDASHIVVNDCHPMKFGCGGESYWRAVLGCQVEFSARDRYSKTELLESDLPCVWTCNPEMDPRQFPDIAKYLRSSGAVVVELGTQPLFTLG